MNKHIYYINFLKFQLKIKNKNKKLNLNSSGHVNGNVLFVLLFVKLVLLLAFLYIALVALLKVLGQDDVAILSHGLHARFLAYGVDVGARYLVRPRYVVLEIYFVA